MKTSIFATIECACCGHKEKCIAETNLYAEYILRPGKYWRTDKFGTAICGAEECDEMAKEIGAN